MCWTQHDPHLTSKCYGTILYIFFSDLHQERRWWKEIDCSWVYWYSPVLVLILEYSYLNFGHYTLQLVANRQQIWIFKCSTQSPVAVTIREAKIKIQSELQLGADYYRVYVAGRRRQTERDGEINQQTNQRMETLRCRVIPIWLQNNDLNKVK